MIFLHTISALSNQRHGKRRHVRMQEAGANSYASSHPAPQKRKGQQTDETVMQQTKWKTPDNMQASGPSASAAAAAAAGAVETAGKAARTDRGKFHHVHQPKDARTLVITAQSPFPQAFSTSLHK